MASPSVGLLDTMSQNAFDCGGLKPNGRVICCPFWIIWINSESDDAEPIAGKETAANNAATPTLHTRRMVIPYNPSSHIHESKGLIKKAAGL